MSFLPSIVTVILADIIIFLFIVLKVPLFATQQTVMVLLLCGIILLNLLFIKPLRRFSYLRKWILVFFALLIVQLTILSTGGIYSPFLILLHLLILGIGIFFDFKSVVLFLDSMILVLLFNSYINWKELFLLHSDPFTLLLYLLSFLVILPVIYLLHRHYKIHLN